MPRPFPHRAGRSAALVGAVAAAAGVLLAAGGASAAAPAPAAPPTVLELPAPVTDLRVLPGVGVLPERLLVSRVPGPVVNREAVEVALGGDGRPELVTMTQRLALTGTGDYVVRERGPARAATALDGTVPPVLRRGTVVWQGFSPGARDLAVELRLDAGLEDERLPLGVRLTFTPLPDGSDPRPLDPGGRVPGAGVVEIVLVNRTTQAARPLPAGDVSADLLAPALDRVLTDAEASLLPPAGTGTDAATPRPSVAGDGLPERLPVTAPGVRPAEVTAPLRVTGAVTVTGAAATVEGPATSPVPGGAAVAGTLSAGEVAFRVSVEGAARLRLDLVARPALDPRALTPPPGSSTWAAWADTRPDSAARRAATDLLVDAAAASALARAYSPYLGADLPGADVRTSFRYVLAEPEAAERVRAALELRPGAVAVASVALLLLLGNAMALRRLS